jgi:hypothetical protein
MAWTAEESHEFGGLLLAMGELFDAPVSVARAELFARAVEDLPFEAVKNAANMFARTGKFFPKPAELRELIEPNLDDRAERAWSAVLRETRRVGYVGTPKFDDEVTLRAAVGLFGGDWGTLCKRLPGEGPELLGYRKQFIALYTATARGASIGELPPRHAEAKAVLEDLHRELERRGLPTGKPKALTVRNGDAHRALKQVARLIVDQVLRVEDAEVAVEKPHRTDEDES